MKAKVCESTHRGLHFCLLLFFPWGFPRDSVVKNVPANAGDSGLIPSLERSPREGNGNPLQYSCLRNPIDRSLAGCSPRGHKRVGHDLATEQQCFPEPSFLHFNFLIIDYSLVLFLLLNCKLLNARDPLSVPSSPCLTPACLEVGHLKFESAPPLEQLHSKQFFFLLA